MPVEKHEERFSGDGQEFVFSSAEASEAECTDCENTDEPDEFGEKVLDALRNKTAEEARKEFLSEYP